MRAVDTHVHVPRKEGLNEYTIEDGLRRFFKIKNKSFSIEEMANMYRQWDIIGVVFSVDTKTNMGDLPDTNDYVATIISTYPNQFVGFATIDPWAGNEAVDELERAVTKLGLCGLKLHPIHQGFPPSDERFYGIYEKCSELDVPIIFHTGFAAAGAGEPGGSGLKLKYSAPIPHIDDIAADFPGLDIIMAHPAWPWVDEQIAVALHKSNVYIDLSGWSPKYIPSQLIKEVNSRLQDKVMFGSDFPYLKPDRWLNEFDQLQLKPEVYKKVIYDNARKVIKGLPD